MICEAGDVVVAAFPFVDRAVIKRRPALVLTRADRNARAGESILAMITTAARSTWPDDSAVHDWQAIGLKGPCVVRLRLVSLDNALIVDRLAPLSSADRTRAWAALSGLFPPR